MSCSNGYRIHAKSKEDNDGTIGRFISPDTIVPDPTNPQSFNRYSYNPLKFTDPSGHFGRDVHYDLTYNMVYYAATYFANRYGLENVEQLATDLAETVAEADQSVDSIRQHPEFIPTKPGTSHWYNHIQATTWVQEAIEDGNPEMFGQSLHALQDYFPHFGQSFIGEFGDSGENMCEILLDQDEHQSFVTEEEWRERSRAWGHGTYQNPKSWDDFDWTDPRCQEMVEENLHWIYQFLEAYFQENYGVLPPDYIDPWLQSTLELEG